MLASTIRSFRLRQIKPRTAWSFPVIEKASRGVGNFGHRGYMTFESGNFFIFFYIRQWLPCLNALWWQYILITWELKQCFAAQRRPAPRHICNDQQRRVLLSAEHCSYTLSFHPWQWLTSEVSFSGTKAPPEDAMQCCNEKSKRKQKVDCHSDYACGKEEVSPIKGDPIFDSMCSSQVYALAIALSLTENPFLSSLFDCISSLFLLSKYPRCMCFLCSRWPHWL